MKCLNLSLSSIRFHLMKCLGMQPISVLQPKGKVNLRWNTASTVQFYQKHMKNWCEFTNRRSLQLKLNENEKRTKYLVDVISPT